MKRICMALAAVFCAAFVFAQSGVSTVVTTGIGNSEEDAIATALENALLQQCGMNISVTRQNCASANVANGESSIKDSLDHQIKTSAQGRIEGFDVVNRTQDPSTGKWTAEVSVRIFSRYILGTDPSSRRRMALAPFASKQKTFTLLGKAFDGAVVLSALEDRLAESFTQTRKFTMLDRKYDAEVNAELARLTAPNASSKDFMRMNQKLATDYLLCAEVSFFAPPASSVNPYTGVATQANTPLLSVAYRVLLAPTGQLKWADSVTMYQDSAIGASADQALVSLVSIAASEVCDSVMKNIIPLRVAEIGEDGRIVLNEGGKSVSVGETLQVFVQGKEIFDPVTKESLGAEEIEVATIQVAKVLPKLSYAIVVTGSPERILRGAIVRRPETGGPRPAVNVSGQSPETLFRTTPQGGVLAPFK